MSHRCESVSADFSCGAALVWQILTDPRQFSRWYGYPDRMTVRDPGKKLLPGTKLDFEGTAGSTVVTALEPLKCLALSTSAASDIFSLAPTPGGCRVSLVTELTGNLSWNGTEAAKEATNREILRQLQAAVGEQPSGGPAAPAPAQKSSAPRSVVGTVVSNLLHGYKNPLHTRSTAFDESDELAHMIDNTESDVAIQLRAAVAAAVLCAILFTILLVFGNVQTSDVVTSSGLSVVQSDNIDLLHAQAITIGETRTSLELALSCRGVGNAAGEYDYSSVSALASGESRTVVTVSYDSYDKVRAFAYLNRGQAAAPLARPVTNFAGRITADMDIYAVERAVGRSASAFRSEKDGRTTIFFGILDTERDLFDETLTAELVVTLDREKGTSDAQYYAPYDPDDPMPYEELNKQYQRQYSNEAYFRADRAAYERLFLLLGEPRAEADILLSTDDVRYQATYDMSIICDYAGASAIVDPDTVRYQYRVVFDYDDIAVRASFRNLYLETRQNTLLAHDSYPLAEGMDLYAVYSTMGLLPSYAEYDGDRILLCYGEYQQTERSRKTGYELTIELDAATKTVTRWTFNR